MMFKVALLQYPIVWADKQANIRLTEQRVDVLRGKADIALLPEMFTTGFCTDRPDLAEENDGETMRRMQALADRTEVAIAGSFIAIEDGKLYNRGFLVRPNDTTLFCDKRHLYAHGENRFFQPGEKQVVWEYKGVRIRMLICYDLRFPVWARIQKEEPYDLLLVSANWPQVRIQYYDALIVARAIENQCLIAAVNPVGDDGMGEHYNGHSVAYNTHLQPIVRFDDDQQGTKIALFDIDGLQHYRQVLPLWRDTDEFRIE